MQDLSIYSLFIIVAVTIIDPHVDGNPRDPLHSSLDEVGMLPLIPLELIPVSNALIFNTTNP